MTARATPVRVEVTPRAARHVRSLLHRDVRTDVRHGLRVALAPGGGPQYRLSLAPAPHPDEIVLTRNGFDVFVARADAAQVDGVRVDYVESDAGSGFLVDRPPAGTPSALPAAPCAVPTGDDDPALTGRVAAVLDDVRPVLVADGGDVELVAVADGHAYVRLQGACNGCGAAAVTLTRLVEDAIRRAVPEVPRTVLVA